MVTDRVVDGFKVDIGSSGLATLSAFAFEGATKKNRPELQPGDLVHARLSLANKDMEPELSCMTLEGRTDGLGPLEGGMCFQVSLSQARKYVLGEKNLLGKAHERAFLSSFWRVFCCFLSIIISIFVLANIAHFFVISLFANHFPRLLHPDNPVIALLTKHMAFDICVGMNGRVWVKAPSHKFTVLLANTLRLSDSMTLDETARMVSETVRTIQA